MFWSHTPIAPWQSQEWLDQMRRQLRPNAYLRMIENRFVSTESNFVDPEWIGRCIDQTWSPVIQNKAVPVYIGVDASVTKDSTAIVRCTSIVV
jgi:phage terminase large subunit-like protein